MQEHEHEPKAVKFKNAAWAILFRRESLLKAIREEKYAIAEMEVRHVRPEQIRDLGAGNGVEYIEATIGDLLDYIEENDLLPLGTVIFRKEFEGTANVQSGYDAYFADPPLDGEQRRFAERLFKTRVKTWWDELLKSRVRRDAPIN